MCFVIRTCTSTLLVHCASYFSLSECLLIYSRFLFLLLLYFSLSGNGSDWLDQPMVSQSAAATAAAAAVWFQPATLGTNTARSAWRWPASHTERTFASQSSRAALTHSSQWYILISKCCKFYSLKQYSYTPSQNYVQYPYACIYKRINIRIVRVHF